MLDLYRSRPRLVPGIDILTARTDLAGTQLASRAQEPVRPTPTIQVTSLLPNYTSAPNTLITKHRFDRPRAHAAAGRLAGAGPHTFTTHRSPMPGTAPPPQVRHRNPHRRPTTRKKLRDYATVAGLLVALGVLAMTVGLIRSETASDLRVLAAAGASSRTRRTLTAATAAALALLGGVLGTASAYLALIAWHWHDVGYLNPPPYLNLAALLVGLPMVALVGGWLLGRTPATIARPSLQ